MAGQQSTALQHTLKCEGAAAGIGLFTGEKVSLKLVPAPPNSGILFQRVDLPGRPEIPATLSNVREATRTTRLATEKGSVHMVEHLLSALRALEIDNVRVEVNGPEIIAGDGSSQIFVDLIESLGRVEQNAPRSYLTLAKPLFWSEGDVHLVALPANEFKVSYTMHYPQSPWLGSQYYSFSLSPKKFKEEIASCRTFSLYEEIVPYIEKGVIKGGGLENALIIKGDQVMNPGGARFQNEPVRHKVLDLIGDLSLMGPFLGHIISIRSGHSSNITFAKMIMESR